MGNIQKSLYLQSITLISVMVSCCIFQNAHTLRFGFFRDISCPYPDAVAKTWHQSIASRNIQDWQNIHFLTVSLRLCFKDLTTIIIFYVGIDSSASIFDQPMRSHSFPPSSRNGVTDITHSLLQSPSPVNTRVLHRAQDLRNSKCIQDECYMTLKHFCATSLYETFPQFWALRAILNSQEEGSERERGQQNKNTNSFFQLCCRNVFSGLGLWSALTVAPLDLAPSLPPSSFPNPKTVIKLPAHSGCPSPLCPVLMLEQLKPSPTESRMWLSCYKGK